MHLPGYMRGYMQSTCPDCQSQLSDRDSACIICGYQKPDRGVVAQKVTLLAMQLKKKWGYLNAQGEWVIPPKFDFVCEFAPNGLACAGEKMPMNPYIAQFYDTSYCSLDSARESVRIHACTWGYINTQGEWVIPPKFSGVDSFAANGLARAMDGEKWGYINTEGEWAIPPKFDAAWDFIPNGLACAGEKREGGKYAIKWGYINTEGEWVIPPRFGNACPFFAANGLACVTSNENGKNGYINRQGEWVIPPRF